MSAYNLFFNTYNFSSGTIKEFIDGLEDPKRGIVTKFNDEKFKAVKPLLDILRYKAALVEEGFGYTTQKCKEEINKKQLEQIQSELLKEKYKEEKKVEVQVEEEPWIHKKEARRAALIASAILSALTVTAFPTNIVKLTGANRVILWLTFTSFQSQAYMWIN